ncbi:SEC14-like protein 5 [Seminavis robusta]|uniref:SEC14-like protein 5 n=1 Tax=Seminavis robusta TaxID=568900 RepID=A0A9N8E743_9STRA|nr:SEC14-like protein 5 [Seminavis robusta]|eukprot:Sro584_g170760.1 SEC14-like protein 5 (382) ;mRNA; f:9640-10875
MTMMPSIQENTIATDMLPPSKLAQHAHAEQRSSHQERWSEANMQQAIKTWKLTDVEIEQLRTLKGALSDVDHFKCTPHEVVRYIRGPKGYDQAEPIFRGMIDWRQNCDEDIDNMLDHYKPPRALYEYAASSLLAGVDHDNDPVYLERAGEMDGYGFVTRYESSTMRNDVIWRRELTASGAWINDYEKKHGHLPRQITVVYDLKGLSSRHMKKGVGAFFKEAVGYTADKYYGVAKRMIIIRAPSIFRMVWRIVQTFFAPEVRAKMVFAGKDHLATLREYMDIDILPPCINPDGHGQAARGFPPSFEAGLIPDDFDDSDELCSYSGNTAYSSFSSADSELTSSTTSNSSVSGKPLLKGSLKMSKCGKLFHLDLSSLTVFHHHK